MKKFPHRMLQKSLKRSGNSGCLCRWHLLDTWASTTPSAPRKELQERRTPLLCSKVQ